MQTFLANTAAVAVLTAASPAVLFVHDALTDPAARRGVDAPAHAARQATARAGPPSAPQMTPQMASTDRRARERPPSAAAARSALESTASSKGG